MIRAIVCVDKNWGIGKDNHLLFDIPEDMEFFKSTTTGQIVCMGYNTLLSLPSSKPLKDRINVVICPADVQVSDAITVHSLDDLLNKLKEFNHRDVYIIGGAMLYKSMLPYCDEILVTRVFADGGADVFFEDLNQNVNFDLVKNSGIKRSSTGKMYCFTIYKNLKQKDLDWRAI